MNEKYKKYIFGCRDTVTCDIEIIVTKVYLTTIIYFKYKSSYTCIYIVEI